MTINENKLNELLGTMVNELGAAFNSILVVVGDKFGLYKAIAKSGRITSQQLADRTETNERYIREWLATQAASGFVTYHPESQTFSMTAEQIAVFADENSPALMTGGFYSLASVYAGQEDIYRIFRTGEGISWGDFHSCLFCGVEKFFRPTYQANLISSWLPALEGVTEKLTNGAKVADLGCGFGASTLIMAEAFPQSQFYGFDIHEPSIQRARKAGQKAGLTNIQFDIAKAQDFPGDDYDLITMFDCLHDMGDPVGATRASYRSLKKDGTMMIAEPFAHDRLEDNLNPVGRLCYSFSTTICTPTSLSQEVGAAIGAQAGESKLREITTAGGFSHFRRAAETPFTLILEARP